MKVSESSVICPEEIASIQNDKSRGERAAAMMEADDGDDGAAAAPPKKNQLPPLATSGEHKSLNALT